jgi:enamine deaminase RidA (YjgF/YER057c/UK114 family)
MTEVSSQNTGPLLRICCPCEKETCSGEVVAIETAFDKEIFVRCAPLRGPTTDLDFDAQARRFYGCLPRLLEQAGANISHVVLERVFFEDFAKDMDSFREIRREVYAQAGVPGEEMPAMTYIQQPPCHEAQKVELQIYALLPQSPDAASVQTFYDEDTATTAKLMTVGGRRHLYIADIKGVAGDLDHPGTFRQQSDRMFANCARLLDRYGVRFPKVLRTWCYITDIDSNYDEFNLSRNAFFAEEGVKRLPASTGIEAGMWPARALCGMDLYALLDTEDATIEVMHTPTLNEAAEYGSSFSRGMKVDLPEKTVLYISGTASVDEVGETVHVGETRKQLDRMLLNVRELLAAQGASFEDLTQIATFLKHAEYRELCESILNEWGIQHVPNTLVEAGVCRPDLLCEMEGIAILPKDAASGKPVPAAPQQG